MVPHYEQLPGQDKPQWLCSQVTAKTGFDAAGGSSKGPTSVLSPSKASAGKGGIDDGMMTPAKGGDKQLYLTEGTTKLRSR
jgi:hypothetical protein